MPRTATDKCLLCQVNDATHAGSHIFSKFISTGFLKVTGQPNKGFDVSIEDGTIKKTTIQDSAKEAHLLCNECEAYLGIVETDISTLFNSVHKNIALGNVFLKSVDGAFELYKWNGQYFETMKLFVYMNYWRASISIKSYPHFKLPPEIEEQIRVDLLNFKSLSKTDLKAKIAATNFTSDYHFCIFTADQFKSPEDNLNFANYYDNPALIIIDKFAFLLSVNIEEIKSTLDTIVNGFSVQPKECNIIVFDEALYHKLFVTAAAKHFIQDNLMR